MLFAVVAWPMTADWRMRPEDTKLFVAIIIGTGVVTAIAAFVVDRKRRVQPPLPMWVLAAYSVATAIGVMIVVLAMTC